MRRPDHKQNQAFALKAGEGDPTVRRIPVKAILITWISALVPAMAAKPLSPSVAQVSAISRELEEHKESERLTRIQGGRMSSMNHWGREHALACVALIALLSGCATNIQGSEVPPVDWVADAPSSQCVALSGSYMAVGMPAPANASAGSYGAVWPTEGLLISIIERGTNAIPRKRPRPDLSADPVDIVPSISFIVDASGSVKFEAKNWIGGTEKLRPQAWTCESGTLTSLVSLGSANFESYVRLWKHDNALIAEQTIRETNAHANGSRAHRPIARFHFRFPSTMD